MVASIAVVLNLVLIRSHIDEKIFLQEPQSKNAPFLPETIMHLRIWIIVICY